MFGGSRSKLARQGENLEKVRSGLLCLVVVGSSLLRVTSSFVPSIRVIKVLLHAHLIHCTFKLRDQTQQA